MLVLRILKQHRKMADFSAVIFVVHTLISQISSDLGFMFFSTNETVRWVGIVLIAGQKVRLRCEDELWRLCVFAHSDQTGELILLKPASNLHPCCQS